MGRISVHKVPISRQRNAQGDAQQERHRGGDFHRFWSEERRDPLQVAEERDKVPPQRRPRCLLTSPSRCGDSLTAGAGLTRTRAHACFTCSCTACARQGQQQVSELTFALKCAPGDGVFRMRSRQENSSKCVFPSLFYVVKETSHELAAWLP